MDSAASPGSLCRMQRTFLNQSFIGIGLSLLAALLGAGCLASPPGDADPSEPVTASAEALHAGGMCTPAQQTRTWARMVEAKIKLPNKAALLDLGGTDGSGITLLDAQEKLCQGSDEGDQFGDGSDVYTFGDNQEVWFDYSVDTGLGNFITVWPGYLGTVDFHGGPHHHADAYVIGVDVQVSKNGAPFQLDWLAPDFDAEVDELYRSLQATFSSDPPEAAGTLCTTTGACVTGTFGDVGFIFFSELGLALWVDSVTAAQPVPSTPTRLDLYKQ
jgi:hypothetical protein